jgi:hypothetical protein
MERFRPSVRWDVSPKSGISGPNVGIAETMQMVLWTAPPRVT